MSLKLSELITVAYVLPGEPAAIEAEQKKLGDAFAAAHPELFRGCTCKRDVIAVMNRWSRGRVMQQQVDRVAYTIARKNRRYKAETIAAMIVIFCA